MVKKNDDDDDTSCVFHTVGMPVKNQGFLWIFPLSQSRFGEIP